MKNHYSGFTLLEVLVSLGLLGSIVVLLFNFLGSTTQSSNTINASNELLREGQIAQQLIAARLKEACYIYPSGSTITMGSSGFTTVNEFGGTPGTGYAWTVNTHPIIAMILPPNLTDPTDGVTTGNYFRFYAYYPVSRSRYFQMGFAESEKPNPDTFNDKSVWMLMEYRKNLTEFSEGTSSKCASMPATVDITGRSGRLLVDYISRANPINSLFTAGPTETSGTLNLGASYVDYSLQLERANSDGKTVVRVGQDSGSTGSGNLQGRIYPQNFGL
jgi:type II secretory pathway pseudopilin PulG